MFGFRDHNKEMVERPDKEPKFSLKNKTDRMIFIFIIVGVLIAAALLTGLILLYYFVPR